MGTTWKSRMLGNTFDWMMMSEKHETIVDPIYFVFSYISLLNKVFRIFVVISSSIVASYVRINIGVVVHKTAESGTNLRRFRIGLEMMACPIGHPTVAVNHGTSLSLNQRCLVLEGQLNFSVFQFKF